MCENNNRTIILLKLLCNIIGPLSAVGSLSANVVRGNITLNWTAPFSLDMPKYRIEINSTTPSLFSNVIDTTEYSFPIGRVCSSNINYTFTVTPVNIAGDGETASEGFTVMVASGISRQRKISFIFLN